MKNENSNTKDICWSNSSSYINDSNNYKFLREIEKRIFKERLYYR